MKFKEWLNDNPPAIVRSVETSPVSAKLQQLQVAIQDTKAFFTQILKIYSLNERTSSFVRHEAEEFVIPSKEFQAYLKTFNTKLQYSGIHGYTKICGDDGCAYFCERDIVIKFCADAKEYDIANRVKGNLEVLPIIDAVAWEVEASESMLYSITMKKLDSSVYSISEDIRIAADIVSVACHRLQKLVEKRPNIPVSYIQKRLSLAYMLHVGEETDADEGLKKALRDFVKVLRLIYEKSGMIVGADWGGGRNYGVTKKKRVQPFDLGRADRHWAAVGKLPEVPEINKIIPKLAQKPI